MGKKTITTQTEEQALKEGKALENAIAAKTASPRAASKKIETGRAYIHATYNNTVITLTDERGNVLAWSSAGSLGFSGPKKATPFAASKVVSVIAEKAKKTGPLNLFIFVNGVGGGRDSAIRSLANQGFTILSIKDVTPVPHNGPKPPKTRRV